MNYGIYKNVRNASWQTLLDYSITALPVNVLKITKANQIKVITDHQIGLLSSKENGISLQLQKEWYIICRDNLPSSKMRYVIAHELGHIFLGHSLLGLDPDSFPKPVEKKRQLEIQADNFSHSLLCPACVLWKTNTIGAEQIAALCDVPMSVAKTRSKRMKMLMERGKFLQSPLEYQVLQNFSEYINRYNTISEVQSQLDLVYHKKESALWKKIK